MRVLIFTSIYPSLDNPTKGTFVQEQVVSLRQTGLEIDVLAFDGKGSAKNYYKAGLKLRQVLNDKSYDIIHAHYGLTGAAALMQTICPIVVTFHGSDLIGEVNIKKKYTLAGKLKTVISRGAALCAAERIVVADFLKTKLWPKSAFTIPMGVDLSLFYPIPINKARDILGYSSNKRFVLFPANPNNPVKRFDIAREAVNLLQETGLNVELVPLYNLSHNQIPLYMNACDVLVLTSMHEASPCVIKEAMACNLPIVSVNVGDVPKRINGVMGCYLCDRDPQDVAAKLRQVFEFGYRTESRNKISELSLQNIADEVLTVYEKVMSSKKKVNSFGYLSEK